jgi:hypothetical protein
MGNLPIECGNQSRESGFSEEVVDVNFLHGDLPPNRDCLKPERIR